MKCALVALAAVVIACVCVLQAGAVPFTQQVQDERHLERETPQENQLWPEAPQEQANPLAFFRTRRHVTSNISLCRYCCNCCRNKGCGYCCRF